ncbi:MAG: hypothetical protein JJU25_10120 [Halomonas sp.]|nr:hypothetical protein [Halomonas sp.]MCC5882976.1 hypothetical protein [Halomonas sp.]
MKTCFSVAIGMVASLTLLPLSAMAEARTPPASPIEQPLAYSQASQDLLASLTLSPLTAPSYAGKTSDLMYLDNGLVLEGSDLHTPDGYTTGFRVTAGFSPANMPQLDLGAEFTYRESDEVPTRHADQALLVNTTTVGGSLVAGVRLGQLGLYAKSGIAEWEGDPVTQSETLYMATTGTARVQGFGARLQHNRFVSRLEFEEIDAPNMAHLNLITASLHFTF